jgi:Zn-dependent protease with chaperone function
MMPPWLWLWLVGYLLAGMPMQITQLRAAVGSYSNPDAMPALLTSPATLTVQRLAGPLGVLPYAVVVASVVALMFPHLRGRWVEWRFDLTSDDRLIMTEMQRFVDAHDPSIRLRVTIRADQMARIYPTGWRQARIAVFRPLAALWRRDRQAAQAILLHEMAHRRQGDQLVAGLGSPFIWLIRIWVPAYVLFVLVPDAYYLAAAPGGLGDPLVNVTGAVQAVLVPPEIVLPVAALWLTELGADQLAAQAIGGGALQRALRVAASPRPSLVAWATALLSHPPRRLRLRRAAAGPAGTVTLLAAWSAVLVAAFLLFPAALTVPVLLVFSIPLSDTGSSLANTVHIVLPDSRTVVIATMVLLIAWPALAGPWEQLWSPGPRHRRSQRWWPYLAGATVPACLLLLSTLPLPWPSMSQPEPSHSACSQFDDWRSEGGLTDYHHVLTDLKVLFRLETGNTLVRDLRRLDTAIGAALAHPPAGRAHSDYLKEMRGYRVAARDLQSGNFLAAANTETAVEGPYAGAGLLINILTADCPAPRPQRQ